ncbi:MAG: phosphoglycerate mutase family protein [Proteobacteria bacterium]|nr:phosphoglycerate mutase family protein [Pseudomonadota bacterium]
MSTIYLIRHGQASFGHSNYDRLSEKGKLQAKMLAEHLLNLNISFDISFTGTLTRHIETEKAFLDVLEERKIEKPESIRIDNLNEYDSEKVIARYIPLMTTEAPLFQNEVTRMFESKRAFQNVFEKIMRRWVSGKDDIPDLVSFKDYKKNVINGIENIMNIHGRGKQIAIFTSGGPVGVLVQMALHLSDQDAIAVTWQVVNSSVSRFKCTADAIMLATFNEYVHLEMNGIKDMITYR